jgi:hypothetical protein
MSGTAGAANGHIGQLSSPAVGEKMSPGRGGALAPVDSGGISVTEAVGPNFVTDEADLPSVVGAQDERTGLGLDRFHCGPRRGDQGAGRPRGQGDDAVTGAVTGPVRAGQLRAGQTASGFHPGPSAPV